MTSWKNVMWYAVDL